MLEATSSVATADSLADLGRWCCEQLGDDHRSLQFDDVARATAGQLGDDARTWAAAWRAAGYQPGERVALEADRSLSWIASLLGAWRAGLTVVPFAPHHNHALRAGAMPAGILPAGSAHPPVRCQPIHSDVPTSHGVALLLATSGSGGTPRWIPLGATQLRDTWDCHRHALPTPQQDVIQILPWFHAFGLILDLLPAILWARHTQVISTGGKDTLAIHHALVRTNAAIHLSSVPLVLERLLALKHGATALQSVVSGIIGGAPLRKDLCRALRGSRFRVGYGQTEAGPGICLGEPGDFQPYAIGRACGCETKIMHGTLWYRGAGVSLGSWSADGLRPSSPEAWRDSGDLVDSDPGGGFHYRGRADDTVKLANGRWLAVGDMEARIRARYPEWDACFLSPSTDTDADLDLHCFANTGTLTLPSTTDLAALFVPLTPRLRLHQYPSSALRCDPKGAILRIAPCPTQ